MDQYLFQQINGLAGQWGWLDVLGIFFAKYFEYALVVLVFIIFCLPADLSAEARRAKVEASAQAGKKWKIIFQAFLAAGIARLVIVNIIRWIAHRPRPFVENHVNLLLSKTSESSFPSGHAAFYFALSFIVYKYNKKAGIVFFVGSFLISISRVFSGIHWPSDILAGAIVGIFSGWLITRIFKKHQG